MIEAIIKSLYMILPFIIIYAMFRKPKLLIVDLTLYEKIIDIDLQLLDKNVEVYSEWDMMKYIENKKLNKINSDKYVEKYIKYFGTKKRISHIKKKEILV